MSGPYQELPGVPQPPDRPAPVVARPILKIKGRRERAIGPRAPRGLRKAARAERKAFRHAVKKQRIVKVRGAAKVRTSAATREFKRMVARGHRNIANASKQAQKLARAQARKAAKNTKRSNKKRRIKKPKRVGGRSVGRGRARAGNSFLSGSIYAFLKRQAMKGLRGAYKSPRQPKDARNHGFTKSGHGGRTGFAGMKPRGKLW